MAKGIIQNYYSLHSKIKLHLCKRFIKYKVENVQQQYVALMLVLTTLDENTVYNMILKSWTTKFCGLQKGK